VPTSRVANIIMEAPAVVVAWQETDSAIASMWLDLLYPSTTDNYLGPGYTGVACTTLGGINCPEPTTVSSGSESGGSSSRSSSRVFRKASARAGLGVGVSAAILLIGTLFALCMRTRKKNKKAKSAETRNTVDDPVSWAAGEDLESTDKIPVIVTSEVSNQSPAISVNNSLLPAPSQNSAESTGTQNATSSNLASTPQKLESEELESSHGTERRVSAEATATATEGEGPAALAEDLVGPTKNLESAALSEDAPQSSAADSAKAETDRLSRLQILEEQAKLLQQEIAAERARTG
jgi:hypothetical protein